MFPKLLTPASPIPAQPPVLLPTHLAVPGSTSPLTPGHGVGKTQHPAGPCSPSAPKTPAVTAPKMNWEHAGEGGLMGAARLHPSHPKVVTAQFNLCRVWQRGEAVRSRCLMWERAPGTVSAQPN